MALTREQGIALARAHVLAERNGDIAATLATLDDDPVYELLPAGRVMRGMDAARAYYEHFFARFRPLAVGSEMHAEWVNDVGVAQEYTITVKQPDGTRKRHRVVSILTFGERGLSGERVYASDELLRVMFGPAFERAVPD
jgi:hypothetical protein